MLATIQSVLSNTNFGGGKLDQKIRARLNGSRLVLFSIDSATELLTVNGAGVLGFSSGQQKDINTARTELGLGSATVESNNSIGFRDGMLASPNFRANTIQDLVHLLNGMISQQFAGQPFNASLEYSDAPVRTVKFKIALGASYSKSVDLDFGTGLDAGFATVSIAGGATASFSVNAGVELLVGIDLDPISAGNLTSATALPASIMVGGTPVKVGMLSGPVSPNGRNADASPITLDLTIQRFGGQSSDVSVPFPTQALEMWLSPTIRASRTWLQI